MVDLAYLWSLVLGFPWASLLVLTATILSIVNGLIFVRGYVRDKPRLVVKPVHPEVYQWFFEMSPGQMEGNRTRRFGFLAYLDVSNSGFRDVAIGGDDWNLCLDIYNGKQAELKSISIPEPVIELGQSGITKTYQVLGIRGPHSSGETMVKSGDSISGFAYYEVGKVVFDTWIARGHEVVFAKNTRLEIELAQR